MNILNVESNKSSEIKTAPQNRVQTEGNELKKIKNGKMKISLAIGILGAIGIAGIAIAKGKRGKEVLKLGDIKFDKGIASHNGKNFTGRVSDVLKNGDKINLKYEDGKIVESTREGIKNFTKKFKYTENGLKTKEIEILNQNGNLINKALLEFGEDGKIIKFENPEKYLTKNGKKFSLLSKKELTEKTWSESGKICRKSLPDGSVKEWNELGKKIYESHPDGTIKTYDPITGIINYSKSPDGTEKEWYNSKSLIKKCIKNPDGTIHIWDVNDKPII